MRRNIQHYRTMLAEHPDATVGFRLAAQACVAGCLGHFDKTNHHSVWAREARRLLATYGEVLTNEQARHELERSLGYAADTCPSCGGVGTCWCDGLWSTAADHLHQQGLL